MNDQILESEKKIMDKVESSKDPAQEAKQEKGMFLLYRTRSHLGCTLREQCVTYLRTIIYYINTNEIPGELSRENLISSHVKITCFFHMSKYRRCYGYIINRAFHTKKLLK